MVRRGKRLLRRPSSVPPQLRFVFEEHSALPKIEAPPWLWQYD
jgi:hypothetical protein